MRPRELSRGAQSPEADIWTDRTTTVLRAVASPVNALIRAAADLQTICESHDWSYCFIGGLAVQRWGEPRSSLFRFPPDVPLRVCSAGDLLVLNPLP